MYRLSDSDSVDSDKGIRYKTDSIRNQNKNSETESPLCKRDSKYYSERKRKSRSRSPHHHDRNKKKKKNRKRRHSSDDEVEEGDCSRNSNINMSEYARKHRASRKSYEENEKKFYNEKCKDDAPFGPALPPKISEISKDDKDPSLKIGPALPPYLKNENEPSNIEKDGVEQKDAIGPALPSTESTKTNMEQKFSDEDSNISENKTYGPSLPPELKKNVLEHNLHGSVLPISIKPGDRTVDPTLPLKLSQISDDSFVAPLPSDDSTDTTIGPSLPPHMRQKLLEQSLTSQIDSSEEVINEDDIYGPVPAGEKYSKAHIELEERALKLKIDQLEPCEDKQPNREEWMLTLPEAKATKFGLGPRQFKSKAGPDLSDRSSWTDTPADKAKKKAGKVEPKIDLQRESELKEIQRRDKEQEVIAKKSKKHKDSLLEIHQKKLQIDKKNDAGPSERRPFSRDIDLQVNRFDEAQKKAVLKKAQLLDNRFSAGESKYL